MRGTRVRVRHNCDAWCEGGPTPDDERPFQIQQAAKPHVDVVVKAKRGKPAPKIDEAAFVDPHVAPDACPQYPKSARTQTGMDAEAQEHLCHHVEAVSDLLHVSDTPICIDPA